MVYSEEKRKTSSKSAQKDKLPSKPEDLYLAVLEDRNSRAVVNKGFIIREGEVHSYEMQRFSFGFMYIKRVCLPPSGLRTANLELTLTPVDSDSDSDTSDGV